jgi:transposase-like protein
VLQRVQRALDDRGLFERDRTSTVVRALGITLRRLGLPLCDVGVVLEGVGGGSREVVCRWHGEAGCLFEGVARERRAVAGDETVVKLGTERWCAWAVVDVGTGEVLAVAVT